MALAGNRVTLGQWFTPLWAAEALVDRYLPWLSSSDVAYDLTAGDGSFLRAIPKHVKAVGVEIDPLVAHQARLLSGREVICGDFRTVNLPIRPTVIIGNPPFKTSIIDALLARSFEVLPRDGTAGFIFPAHAVQTPSRVMRYLEQWSLQVEQLPRTLFPGLSRPLVFAVFRKSQRRVLVGLALYEETRDVETMPARYREALRRGKGAVWYAVVDQALADLNDEADLQEIYEAVRPRRPTENPWWQQKVRQTLRQFNRVGRARYSRRLQLAA